MKTPFYRFGLMILLAALCLLVSGGGLALGSKTLPLSDIWTYFAGRPESYNMLVIDNRIPRTLSALLCGAALGLSGAMMQGLTRNPLADTGLLGINAGAAASLATGAFFPMLGLSAFWLAVPGALLTALAVCIIGMGGRQSHYTRLILAGAAVAAVLHAYVGAVSQFLPQTFDYLRFWSSGSFAGTSLGQIQQTLYFFIPATLIGIGLGKYVNIIALDKQAAKSLGANLLLIQSMVLLSAAVLAAAAVALAGPVGFVGLGAAHITRRLTGNDYRYLLPCAMLCGSLLLAGADVVSRIIVAPSEVAAGIITSLLGAPLLYVMVIRRLRNRA